MDPDNALRLALDRSRVAHLRLQRLHSENSDTSVELTRGIHKYDNHGGHVRLPNQRVHLRALLEDEFRLTINGQDLHVPYGAVLHAWRTAGGAIGLKLDCVVVVDDQGVPALG